jgi:predicted Zn-dependent protease with MMP-like domain
MRRRAFEELVATIVASLPPFAREALRDVAVLVEEEDPDDPDLYGVYDELPARIVVFRRPLSEDYPDPRELREQVRITVLHEVGHHLGMDEDRLDDLGYG